MRVSALRLGVARPDSIREITACAVAERVASSAWGKPRRIRHTHRSRRFVPHGDFSSRDDLISKIESDILGKNETAKPYRWTYDGTPLKAA